jgi:uncharacterized protein (TIGR02996 family)
MRDDEAFLAAIRADPADAAPWLIYADWLEEHGDPRAALYRHPRRTNSIGVQLVLVPRGIFWMGDRGSKRPVEVPHESYIGAFPVTQEQWQTVMGDNPSEFSLGGEDDRQVRRIPAADLKQFPVEQVSWDDVQEFLNRLNEREKSGGLLYRLPTEAEWEYACRGAATSPEECAFDFYFSQPTNDLSSKQANFDGRYPAGNAPLGKNLGRTTKVGSYQPNRLGIYDMHGNVWEWCADRVIDRDPTRPRVVIRGGSCGHKGSFCRASFRRKEESWRSYGDLGFRLVAVPSSEEGMGERRLERRPARRVQ